MVSAARSRSLVCIAASVAGGASHSCAGLNSTGRNSHSAVCAALIFAETTGIESTNRRSGVRRSLRVRPDCVAAFPCTAGVALGGRANVTLRSPHERLRDGKKASTARCRGRNPQQSDESGARSGVRRPSTADQTEPGGGGIAFALLKVTSLVGQSAWRHTPRQHRTGGLASRIAFTGAFESRRWP